MSTKIRNTTAEAIALERIRIKSILESPEGLDRPNLARALALGTVLDTDAAVQLLQAAPVERTNNDAAFLKLLESENTGLTGPTADFGRAPDAKEARKEELAKVAKAVSGKAGRK